MKYIMAINAVISFSRSTEISIDSKGNFHFNYDRDGSPPTPLAGERLRPLGHVSTDRFT